MGSDLALLVCGSGIFLMAGVLWLLSLLGEFPKSPHSEDVPTPDDHDLSKRFTARNPVEEFRQEQAAKDNAVLYWRKRDGSA